MRDVSKSNSQPAPPDTPDWVAYLALGLIALTLVAIVVIAMAVPLHG